VEKKIEIIINIWLIINKWMTIWYPESRGMEEGSWARRSQDLVLGCWNIVSLHGMTEETGKRSSPAFWVFSVLPAQQQSIHSINLKKTVEVRERERERERD